jgi:hypothetical protein
MAGPVKPMAWGLRWNGKEAVGTTANPKHGLVRTPWADHLEATTAHGPTDSMRSDLLELLIDTHCQRLSLKACHCGGFSVDPYFHSATPEAQLECI